MSEIFRDPTEGAMARRQELLRKRRDELVMMPHMIRRVIVARAARTAAAQAAIVCGLAMIAVALSPSLATTIASGLPGINPAVISTALGAAWILGLVAFAISRGRAEHRFAVAMSTYVLPGDNLDHDIERLSHERPDKVARAMAHHLEVRSAALPIAAAAFVLPATLLYIAKAIAVRGWPSTADYEVMLAEAAAPLAATGLLGLIAAVVMTRSFARRASLVPFTAFATLLFGGISAAAIAHQEIDLLWLASTLVVITGAAAAIGWRLARERKALEILDPAAGSELFTLRGLIASVRRSVVAIRQRVTPSMALGATAVAALLVVAGSPVSTGTRNAQATSASASVHNAPLGRSSRPIVLPDPGNSSFAISATSDGRIRIDATFVNGKSLLLEGLGGIAVVPQGWRARITVSIANDTDAPASIAVNPILHSTTNPPLHLGDGSSDHRFNISACDGPVDLGLSMAPIDTWSGSVSFLVEPHLELATCDAN
jgi:hypothetical protein